MYTHILNIIDSKEEKTLFVWHKILALPAELTLPRNYSQIPTSATLRLLRPPLYLSSASLSTFYDPISTQIINLRRPRKHQNCKEQCNKIGPEEEDGHTFAYLF